MNRGSFNSKFCVLLCGWEKDLIFDIKKKRIDLSFNNMCWIDADIDGRGDTKRIYGITAVGGKVKPEKDVRVNYLSSFILYLLNVCISITYQLAIIEIIFDKHDLTFICESQNLLEIIVTNLGLCKLDYT